MKAEWSQQARADLLEIFHRVAADNPGAARKLLERLKKSEELVLEHPLAGRVVPEFEVANIRERILRPYRVIYQVQRELILFLTVIHGRQSLRGIGDASFVVPDSSPQDSSSG